MPVAAVIFGGSPTVSSGSRMTMAGTGGRESAPSGASTPPPVPTERSISALRQMKVESQPKVDATISTGGAA
ncbi:hypothetical protein G6F23_014227 [Rhizopus arrhizus]|nr:hypothetical protein G6F23_014227 [Rhizopus arrhizus]